MEGRSRPKHSLPGILLRIAAAVCILVPLLLSAVLLIPRAFGLREYTVVSASMEPALPVGSLLFVEEAAPETLEPGEIVAFASGTDPDTVITHRLTENREEDRELVTRGDANEREDLSPVPYDRVIGRVARSVPGIGTAVSALRTVPGILTAAGLLAAGTALWSAAQALDRHRSVPDDVKGKR